MAPAFHVQTLASTESVRVDDVRCAAAASPLGAEGAEDIPRLVLPRRGVFSWQAAGAAEPGGMLVLVPDEPYRFGHPADGGGDCLRIGVAAELWTELLDSAGFTHGPVRLTRLPLSGPRRYRNAVFARAASVLASEPAAVEELALLQVRTLLAELPGAAPPARRSHRPRRSADARRVLAEEAAGFVATRYTEHLPGLLHSASAALHCSPFHLTRVFHAEVGVTLRQFRERLRFADALRMLDDDGDGLAALAHHLGYASHSHFTAAFRRTCGATPREARAALRRADAADLRKILTA